MSSVHLAHKLVVCGLCLTASLTHATNGYSPTGFGTTNKGLAGAGVALPQDTLAGATNPAGMVMLGNRADIGIALFNPNRGFTANPDGGAIPPGEYDSDNDWFVIPHFGWNRPLDANSSIGVSLGGNGGMNTDYDEAVWQNFSNPAGIATAPTGVDFAQLFLGITYARKINERHAFGIMPIVAVQRFEAEGLEPFQGFSINPTKVTNNGYDYSWGYGLRVGWLGQLTDQLTVGISAQTKTYMTEFDDYKGLFAEQGDFDIPPTVTVGLSFKAAPDVTIVFDWQRIFYGDVAALGNSNTADFFTNPAFLLGADDGLGFGWEDINIYKLGVQWDYSPKLTLRAGVSHADQLFDNGKALFNILAPATIRTHASIGFTYQIDAVNYISGSYTRAFDEKIKGSSPLTGTQTGFVEMDQHEVEISWGRKFN